MNGVQALVRLPMLQRQRDLAAGLNTGGFHQRLPREPARKLRSSPVGGQANLQANHVVFQPGVNEELAATALWGTQQLDLYPDSKQYGLPDQRHSLLR